MTTTEWNILYHLNHKNVFIFVNNPAFLINPLQILEEMLLFRNYLCVSILIG